MLWVSCNLGRKNFNGDIFPGMKWKRDSWKGMMHGRKATCVSNCSQEIVGLRGQKLEKGKSFSIELKLLEA